MHQRQESIAPLPHREPKASVYTPPVQTEFSNDTQPDFGAGLALQVPAVNALQSQLDLARALRPLMRKIPSPTQRSLDEEATAIQIAQGIWSPVLVHAPERWFDLAIVVEDSPSLKLWEDTIAEFKTLVEQQGAFRQIQTWGLQGKAGEGVQLSSNWRPDTTPAIQPFAEVARNVLWQLGGAYSALLEQRPASTLLDPTGRRIIWLVSDCTSDLWDSPSIYEWVEKWGKYSPLAIVQLFPERLWARTALEVGQLVRLYASTPGATQARLSTKAMPLYPVLKEEETQAEISDQEPEGDSGGNQPKSIILPVISLEPQPVNRWAKVTVGVGYASVTGLQISLNDLTPQFSSFDQTSSLTPEQRVQQFCATASITAQKLAGLMAAVPVSLPVAHLIQKNLLPRSRQVHLAEVFMSGLLDTAPPQSVLLSQPTQYYFPEPVREKLIDAVPISKTTQVLDTVSAYVCDRLGLSTKSFAALIASIPNLELVQQQAVQPFAEIGLNTLRRLGGDYRKKADQLAPLLNPSLSVDTPQAFPDLQILDFETVRLVDNILVPPLQMQDVEVVTIVLDDKPQTPGSDWQLLQFELATIALRKKPRQSKQRKDRQLFEELNRLQSKWVIRRYQQERVSLLIESLGAIDLEMVLIPSGKFMMGAYVNEKKQDSSEKPRHEVSVEIFLMSRYPVTQAQWHFVAELDQVDRELNLNPSRFKGENRPVERVSWYDAVEFCNRLSAYTKRDYRLPTEAEWEYACRAGTTTPFHFGETISPELANYDSSRTYNGGPQGKSRGETTPVNQFGIANAFGLSDMHGNVWEWCADHWHGNYEGAPTDGSAWITEDRHVSRVLRGGSWDYSPGSCRSAFRGFSPPDKRDTHSGFRVVCVASSTL
jgi:formylglycine-generating enzyme required for sulfatase activity